MSEYPEFGTAKIKCGKRKCDWTGLETDLVPDPKTKPGAFSVQKVCPKCSCNSYSFVKPKKAIP